MKQVALLQMPWGVTDRATLSLGLLKKILESKGISSKVYYLNLRFLKYVNPDVYNIISRNLFHIGEWIFGQFLFGELSVEQKNMGFSSLIEGICSKGDNYRLLMDQLICMKSELDTIINDSVPLFIDDCLNTIPWENINIAGFSCKVGGQLSSLALAYKLKKRFPHIKIVFGGPNVFDKMGEEIIRRFEWIDYVIDGEGEKSFTDLAVNIINNQFFENIPGVLMRCNDSISINKPGELLEDLDSLPIPDYSEYFEELQNSGLTEIVNNTVIPYESTRGCWWCEKDPCTFCAVNNGMPRYRSKSSKKVLEEILAQRDRYHIKDFYAADSILNMDFFNDLIPDMARRNLGLDIYHDVKPFLNRHQLKLLYESGIKTVLAGIESLNNELLKLMHKGVTAIQNIQLLKLCRETGIYVSWNLLYGIPGEDPACYSQMINTIPSISHLTPPGSVVRISLDRFSPYHCQPEKYGIKNIRPAVLYEYIYPDKRINLNNIAYTFEYDYENSIENIGQYVNRLINTYQKWRKVFHENMSKCEYTVNGEHIEIIDTRPGIYGERTESRRKYSLTGIEKELYIYCDETRSFSDIFRYLNEKCPKNIGKDTIEAVLREFIDRKLMFRENSKYLSLAVRTH